MNASEDLPPKALPMRIDAQGLFDGEEDWQDYPTAESTPRAGLDIGLLILRLAFGGLTALHGVQHLFGLVNGMGIQKFTDFLANQGFSHVYLLAYLIGWTEAIAGGFVILGLFTPLSAAFLSAIATITVILNWKTGYEMEFLLVALGLGLSFTGPGRVALDNGQYWYRHPMIGGGVSILLASASTAGLILWLHA
jgi:putative oxidoreductase